MSSASAPARELRVQWTRWFHCESSFNLGLVPSQPGLFAIAEEVPCRDKEGHNLNVIQVEAVDDLFHALNSLYAQDCALRRNLEKNRCFLRYAVLANPDVRNAAVADLKRWLEAPGEVKSCWVSDFQHVDHHPTDTNGVTE